MDKTIVSTGKREDKAEAASTAILLFYYTLTFPWWMSQSRIKTLLARSVWIACLAATAMLLKKQKP
jgi:hypothetical protein